MADQISTLGLAVDTTGVKSASTELDKVTEAGNRSAISLDRVEALLAAIDASSRSMAQSLAAAAKSNTDVATSAKQADDAGRRLIDSLREQSALFGKSAEDVLRYRAAQAGVASEAAPLILQLQNQRAAQRLAAEAALAEAAAQREAAAAKSSVERAQQSFLAGLREQAETMGKTRAEMLEYRAAQLGVSEQAAPLIKRLGDLDKAGQGVGVSSKLAAFQAQQLSFQLNDLFVQIASGGSPLTALIQQGSQLSGTFGGIGAAARAAGGFILGLLNPLTLAVGAAAALAYAYEKGAQEGRAFTTTLILTGNAAGTTAGALADMARQVNALGAGTVGRAAEVLNQFAQTGQVAAGNLTAFTNAALAMERAGGPAVEETVKAFADLGKAPLQASQRLNESMNYLTRSTYDQIRALEQQGRTIEAAQVAQKAFADALAQRTPQMEQNIGLIERAWRAVKEAVKGAGDAVLNIGRPLTDAEKLKNLQEQLAARRERNSSIGIKDGKATQDLQDEINLLSRRMLLQTEAAAAQGALNDKEKAYQDFTAQGDQYLTSREQLTKALTAARNQGVAAGLEEEAIEKRLAQIRRAFDPGAGEAIQLARIDDTKRNLNSLVAAYQDSEQLLEANRQAGLISEKAYFDAKIGFVKLNAEAQRRLVEEDTKAQQVLLQNPNLNTAERVAIQTRIKDNIAEIVKIQNSAATSGIVLARQQTSAQQSLAAAYVETRSAAEEYLRTLQRANARDLEGAGLGTEERARRAGRNQIADKYADDRARLEAQIEAAKTRNGGELTDEQSARFTNELNLISEFRDKALAEYDAYYAKRREQEANAATGASEALANWTESNRNAARSMQEAYERTFSSLEDTLATFFKSGKLNVKSLVDTVLTELARLEAKRFLSSFGGAFGSVLGSIFGVGRADGGAPVEDISWVSGGRAIGGPVSAGQTYEVNERDIPEIARVGGRDYLTMGGQGGKVTPLTGQLGGTTFNFTIAPGVTRAELASYVPEIVRQVKASVAADSMRPGGRS